MSAQIQAVTDKILIVGETAIHGVHLIGEELMRVLALAVSLAATPGLPTIRLCEDKPQADDGKDIFARLYVDTDVCMVNLIHHYNDACEQVIEDGECTMSLRALIFYSLLITIFHEAKHVDQLNNHLSRGGTRHDFVWGKEQEEEAKDWADKMITELAKTYPTEIEALWEAEEKFFDPWIKEALEVFESADEKDVMAKFQVELLNKKIVAHIEAEDQEDNLDIMSFVEWFRRYSDCPNDPAWKEEVIEPVQMTIEHPVATETPPSTTTAWQAPIQPTEQAPATAPAPTAPAPTDIYDLGPDEYDYGVEDAYYDTPMPEAQAPFEQPGAGFTPPANNQTFVNPVMAASGQTNTTQPAQGGQQKETCEPMTIQLEEVLEIVKKVTLRLYTHVFTKCGFDPNAPTSFTNAGAVFEPVSIADIPNVEQVFKKMDVTDEQGKYQRGVPIQGQIRGVVFNKSGLPGYWLYVNAGGTLVKRTLVPQNPNKLKNGGPAPMARKVREGHCIAWMIADEAPFDKKMKAKIEAAPGSTINYTPNPFG